MTTHGDVYSAVMRNAHKARVAAQKVGHQHPRRIEMPRWVFDSLAQHCLPNEGPIEPVALRDRLMGIPVVVDELLPDNVVKIVQPDGEVRFILLSDGSQ